ncbi:MAG TPA: histidine kinase dimerization/phospho-acceptor domain-containing protein [Terriglobales bacterium]|nr:histidine kinase dimerization/phospho-acceptor domain-containing protein [Terriglobales bacterium]
MSRRTQFWIALAALTAAQVAASLFMRRGEALTIASDLIQGFLLLVATAAYIPKTFRGRSATTHARLFWILMSLGMIFWVAYQSMWNYFEVIRRTDVPDPFAGDVVLFLHLVPMIAALGVLPHLRGDERDERIRMLDFALLMIWWVFIYVYLVIPWQTAHVDQPTYSSNFNFAYLTEKSVLLGSLAVLAFTAHGGWRHLYGQFLGAGALYASSSYFANYAIGHKTYYSGSVYDIPLTVSVAWFAAIPVLSSHYDLSDAKSTKPLLGVGITRMSMLALCTLPWAALHAELDTGIPSAVRAFRIVASLLAAVVMGVMVFWRQRLLAAELTYFLDKSHRSVDELQLLQSKLIHSEKLASLGQLVGGAAHEINNPLTAMLGYSDLLSASNLPAEEQRQALAIGEQVRRTKTLVASLLTFAQQGPSKLASVDINSLLQTAMRLLAPQLESHGVVSRLELRPSLPAVLADSNQLLHVCRHLASQIGGQFDANSHSALLIRTSLENDSVVIEFLTGAPTLHRPVCDQQLNAEGANKPSTLSLSACSRIVEEHGGRLLRPGREDIHAFRLEFPTASKSASGQPRAAAHGAF